MNRDIRVVVKDRVARTEGQPVIVCGNGDYTITFSFDEEWDGVGTKTARFKYLTAEGVKHQDKELKGDTVWVPSLSNIREVEVGVYSADIATSTGAPIRCEPSIRCGSGDNVSPDVTMQETLFDIEKLIDESGVIEYDNANR